MKFFHYLITVLLFTFLFVACGSNEKTADDMFADAKTLLQEGKTLEALGELEHLLAKFPDTKYKQEVSFQLGQLYNGRVVKTMGDDESYKKAIEYYKKSEVGSDENLSSKALFMIAYVHHNYLHNYGEAKATYEEYIKKYPDSDLADDAASELAHLTQAPEEYLQNKTEKTE